MNTFEFLAPLLFISGVAVLVLVIVAIAQDLRQERKYGYRQAFYTIVSLVMLVLTVGSGIMLLTIGLRESVLTSAKTYQARYSAPPQLFLPGNGADKTGGNLTAYECSTVCQFTADDKASFAAWRETYGVWQKDADFSLSTRRDLAGGLSLFIVALPLYLLFVRWMNRGAKDELQSHQKSSPLRSVYFYGMSFGGLVLAVVGGAMLLNSVIGTWLKTGDSNTSRTYPVVKEVPGGIANADTIGVDSIIACGEKCDFTANDIALANKWKVDWAAYQAGINSNTGATANNLATTIPLVLFGVPLFWLHFARIRKETQTTPSTPTVA